MIEDSVLGGLQRIIAPDSEWNQPSVITANIVLRIEIIVLPTQFEKHSTMTLRYPTFKLEGTLYVSCGHRRLAVR